MEDIEAIDKIVKKEVSLVKETGVSMDGLCIYFANNIGLDLYEEGIPYGEFNIKDYTDIDYTHVFLVAYLASGKYCLIDPSYSQFLHKNADVLYFKAWPSDVLGKSENGKRILKALTTEGYMLANGEDIKEYISSFDDKSNYLKLDDDIKGMMI